MKVTKVNSIRLKNAPAVGETLLKGGEVLITDDGILFGKASYGDTPGLPIEVISGSATTSLPATAITFDKNETGLNSETVQSAITEVLGLIPSDVSNSAVDTTYDNTIKNNYIDAENVQDAVDNLIDKIKAIPSGGTEDNGASLMLPDIISQELLLEDFSKDYVSFAGADITIDEPARLLEFFNYNTKWKWVKEYIIKIAEAQSYVDYDILISKPILNSANWIALNLLYTQNVYALLNGIKITDPVTIDFSSNDITLSFLNFYHTTNWAGSLNIDKFIGALGTTFCSDYKEFYNDNRGSDSEVTAIDLLIEEDTGFNSATSFVNRAGRPNRSLYEFLLDSRYRNKYLPYIKGIYSVKPTEIIEQVIAGDDKEGSDNEFKFEFWAFLTGKYWSSWPKSSNYSDISIRSQVFINALVAMGGTGGGGSGSNIARDISYDASASSLTNTDVQGAIDELSGAIDGISLEAGDINNYNIIGKGIRLPLTPSQEDICKSFVDAYNEFSKERKDIGNFKYSTARLLQFFDNVLKWSWVKDYIISKAIEQEHPDLELLRNSRNWTTNPSPDEGEVSIREVNKLYTYNMHACLNQTLITEEGITTIDFTTDKEDLAFLNYYYSVTWSKAFTVDYFLNTLREPFISDYTVFYNEHRNDDGMNRPEIDTRLKPLKFFKDTGTISVDYDAAIDIVSRATILGCRLGDFLQDPRYRDKWLPYLTAMRNLRVLSNLEQANIFDWLIDGTEEPDRDAYTPSAYDQMDSILRHEIWAFFTNNHNTRHPITSDYTNAEHRSFIWLKTLNINSTGGSATDISYNDNHGLNATNVQAAIDQLVNKSDTAIYDALGNPIDLTYATKSEVAGGGVALTGSDIAYTPSSELSSNNVQAAIDELAARPSGGSGQADISIEVGAVGETEPSEPDVDGIFLMDISF